MITRYRSFDEMLNAAQKAISKHSDAVQATWMQKLLDILKDGKYATIRTLTDKVVDVSRIAHTYQYLSFFDAVNDIVRFDTTVEPIVTNQLKNKLTYNLFDKTELS